MKIIILLLMVSLPAGLACSEDPLDFFTLDGLSVSLSEQNTLRLSGAVTNGGLVSMGVQVRMTLRSVDGKLISDSMFWLDQNIPAGAETGFDIPVGSLSLEIVKTKRW